MDSISYEINYNCIDANVRILLNNLDTPLDNITNPEVDNAYKIIKILSVLGFKTSKYDELLRLLQKNKPDKPIKPNTIGDFLYGCKPTSNSCSPACLNGITPTNITKCKNQVWVLSNGVINKINNDMSEIAEIYVDDIKQLKDKVEIIKKAGGKIVNVYSITGDKIMDNVKIDELLSTQPPPNNNNNNKPTSDNPNSDKPKNSTADSGSTFRIITGILVIIILIIGIMILWKLYKKT